MASMPGAWAQQRLQAPRGVIQLAKWPLNVTQAVCCAPAGRGSRCDRKCRAGFCRGVGCGCGAYGRALCNIILNEAGELAAGAGAANPASPRPLRRVAGWTAGAMVGWRRGGPARRVGSASFKCYSTEKNRQNALGFHLRRLRLRHLFLQHGIDGHELLALLVGGLRAQVHKAARRGQCISA